MSPLQARELVMLTVPRRRRLDWVPPTLTWKMAGARCHLVQRNTLSETSPTELHV